MSRVLITGAASGLGAALATAFEARGDEVLRTDLRDADLNLDVTSGDDWAAALAHVERTWGGLDVLVNNAGVAGGGRLDVATIDEWRWITEINLFGVVRGTATFVPMFKRQRSGTIVNTASLAGNLWKKRAEPINALLDLGVDDWGKALQWFDENHESLEQGPYNFSKEVVEVYTMRSSRPAMQRGVRTNSVCPGPIDTPLLPDFRASTSDQIIDWNIREMNGRAITPREVAQVLAFYGSPAASYVNGTNLDIDGGFTAALTTKQVDFSGRA